MQKPVYSTQAQFGVEFFSVLEFLKQFVAYICPCHIIFSSEIESSYHIISLNRGKTGDKMEVESPMLHLPFRRLKNLFSTSTLAIEKDIQAIAAKIQSLNASRDHITLEDASEALASLITRLELLQRKVCFQFSWFCHYIFSLLISLA
jgi:hypothetical protein